MFPVCTHTLGLGHDTVRGGGASTNKPAASAFAALTTSSKDVSGPLMTTLVGAGAVGGRGVKVSLVGVFLGRCSDCGRRSCEAHANHIVTGRLSSRVLDIVFVPVRVSQEKKWTSLGFCTESVDCSDLIRVLA